MNRPARTALLGIAAAILVAGTVVVAPLSTAARLPTRPRTGPYVPHQLLVRLQPGLGAGAIAPLRARFGATTLRSFGFVPGLELLQLRGDVSVAPAAAAFASVPGVRYAQPNWVSHLLGASQPRAALRVSRIPNDPRYGEQWDWQALDAPAAWDLTVGSKSVVVGDIDSGLDYDHVDIRANAWKNLPECRGVPGLDDDHNGYVDDCHGIDTINGDSDPMDDNGHGTLTAGVIGAVGDNGVGITGLNWRVRILPCKSHDAQGSGSVASIIECYQYMVTEKKAGHDIIATNNSYADCPEACGYDPATRDGIDAMGKAGILFAVAAGNNGRDIDLAPIYPASYFLPNVIPAAATTPEFGLATFSNWGVRVVMVGAPGEDVLSTTLNDGYDLVSGTSLASPHVAGLAALLHANDPSLDIYQIRNLIVSGGNDFGSLAGMTVSGKSIDANGSLTCTDSRVFGLLQPLENVHRGQLTIAALSIDCAGGDTGGGRLKGIGVRIEPGDLHLTLRDNGKGSDLSGSDGIFSSFWTPAGTGTYTLSFRRHDVSYTVTVSGSAPPDRPERASRARAIA
jgi:subtilisin family serine protease